MGPFEGIGSISSWAHTQVTLSLVDGPTWGFPMLWANLHVGFFVLIGTILLHYVGTLTDFGCSDMDTSEAPGSGTAGVVTIPSVEATSSTTGRTYGSEGTASARAGGPSQIPAK